MNKKVVFEKENGILNESAAKIRINVAISNDHRKVDFLMKLNNSFKGKRIK